MTANNEQIGGFHYKTSYEHWDLVIKIPMGYLEGCATKYVSRWRKKGGLQDLKKAAHYLDKLIEVQADYLRFCPEGWRTVEEVRDFAKANQLTYQEEQFVHALCSYQTVEDLIAARQLLSTIIDQALVRAAEKEELNQPGTPEDGGHHQVA